MSLHFAMDLTMDFEEVNFADGGVGIGATRIGDTSDEEPDDDNSVTYALIIYLMITRMKRRREKERSIWVHQINQERPQIVYLSPIKCCGI